MNPWDKLCLDKKARASVWRRVQEGVEAYMAGVHQARVSPLSEPENVRQMLHPFTFDETWDPIRVVDFIIRGLWDRQVHVAHPRYYGLFNPAPTTMGIAADTLAAAFNPQLASWNHSPFAVEVECHVIRALAGRFGYNAERSDGTFTTGGAEANMTALLTALVDTFPEYAERGLRGLAKQPTMYVSVEGHHSFLRAARFCGLGTDAVREVPVDGEYRMDVKALVTQMESDRKAGAAPFLIVANAGTTNGGVIDPLEDIASVANRENVWYHMDAAWGGAAVFVDELRPFLNGIESSDSITFDSHKWLSVPMGAGLYLTRHPGILDQTFRITADYMPPRPHAQEVVDPYKHSIQCSRRFIGLKVFLSLAVAGWEGYGSSIRHQTAVGDLLRKELGRAGWEVINRTPLPLVCFVDGQHPRGKTQAFIDTVAREIVSSGKAWISATRLGRKTPVLRACITNCLTNPEDIRNLVQSLNQVRENIDKK